MDKEWEGIEVEVIKQCKKKKDIAYLNNSMVDNESRHGPSSMRVSAVGQPGLLGTELHSLDPRCWAVSLRFVMHYSEVCLRGAGGSAPE